MAIAVKHDECSNCGGTEFKTWDTFIDGHRVKKRQCLGCDNVEVVD